MVACILSDMPHYQAKKPAHMLYHQMTLRTKTFQKRFALLKVSELKFSTIHFMIHNSKTQEVLLYKSMDSLVHQNGKICSCQICS